MSDYFSLEAFDKGYVQALNDVLKIYEKMESYDEIFVCQLRRKIKELKEKTDEMYMWQ